MAIFYRPKKFCIGYYNLGLVLKKRRRYEQAIFRMERANALCPNHASTLLELGDLYERTSRMEDARSAYKKCHDFAKGTLLGERCRTREVALR
jgi:tetratricopeptide (TPR) repeat protein